MKKILIFFLLCISFSLLSGCNNPIQGKTEINNLDFIRIIAVDKSDSKKDYVKLTIMSSRVKSPEKAQEKTADVLFAEGRTLFEAIRNLNTYQGRKPFFGDLEYILIGDEVATDDIKKYLDFFSRDHEIRLNSNIFVVKERRAEEILLNGNKPDELVFEKIKKLIDSKGGLSISNVVELKEVMYILDLNYLSLYLPCIELTKRSSGTGMDVRLADFAVFNNDKLVGYLDDKQSKGLNWLMNKVESGVIVVEAPDGHNISLEIIDTNSKKIPKISEGKIIITLKIDLNSNIDEMQTSNNIFTSKDFEYLNEQQKQKVKDEVESCLQYAKKNNVDFFSIGFQVFHKYPIAWQDTYEANWKSLFKDVQFDIIVNSKITRTYNITQPNDSKGVD